MSQKKPERIFSRVKMNPDGSGVVFDNIVAEPEWIHSMTKEGGEWHGVYKCIEVTQLEDRPCDGDEYTSTGEFKRRPKKKKGVGHGATE